nr:immunoglobulin light chain junction region [Macaca mulatta]MOV60957.1 immunoglobulin light chain junction region [Macaca mulatta]MOV62079.1 immunoglobulin light chain junction region [Macaca mulatta]MOV62564.1 immunoglobulin light chain junction region [Macaca mulatta]MOV62914.1 immunoglobulin light chain junction region [Macaca mulatta]
CLQSKNSPWTF